MDAYRNQLGCRETAWLHDELAELRGLAVHAKQLAVIAELDARGRLAPTFAAAERVSQRTARQLVETARALDDLPAIASAAAEGRLSAEQLTSVVALADHESDSEWAARAPAMAPAELARLARCQEKPTTEDSQARREARHLRIWWSPDHGMLHLRGALADVDGAAFEQTNDALVEKMRPAKGQPWDTRDHRAADALVSLCDHATRSARDEPAPLAPRPLFVVEVPLTGPAAVAGVPIADTIVEQWRANADLEAVLVDDDGLPVALGRKTPALSPKLARAIWLRDQQCRCGTCDRRHGLHIHHLRPRTWGGTDDPANLVLVCARGPDAHHPLLIPHGPYALVGNPNQVGGLRMIHLDDLTPEEAAQIGLPRDRAGPHAA